MTSSGEILNASGTEVDVVGSGVERFKEGEESRARDDFLAASAWGVSVKS